MRAAVCCAVTALLFATGALAADFGTQGEPAPANIDELADVLRLDPYDMELLISFGTSKGGSAGHLALAIREMTAGDDAVYSASRDRPHPLRSELSWRFARLSPKGRGGEVKDRFSLPTHVLPRRPTRSHHASSVLRCGFGGHRGGRRRHERSVWRCQQGLSHEVNRLGLPQSDP